jgi:site-specific DNA-methyltransferase (adenine-specific)
MEQDMNADPDTKSWLEENVSDFAKNSKNDGIFRDGMSYKTISTVLEHPKFGAFEKNSNEDRKKNLKSKDVPFEFLKVIRMKSNRKNSHFPIDFPMDSLVNRTARKTGSQTVVWNDSLEELKNHVKDASFDLVMTSPPYNIGIDYAGYNDTLPQDSYFQWMDEIAKELFRVLKEDGSFFLNVGSTSVNPYIAMDVCNVMRNTFVLQNEIKWVKNISIEKNGGVESYGHYKPINSKRFLNNCFESIFHFTKKGNVEIDRLANGVPYTHKSNINRWGDEGEARADLRCAGNVWHVPYETVMKEKKHPASYPKKLVEKCFKMHGVQKGMTVLDPFLGSGTTLAVCQQMGLKGYGIELTEQYAHMSYENLCSKTV